MPLAAVFDALGDPTRFAIVEKLLAEQEATAGDLAAPFALSKPAISRHLKVLESAGVIERHTDRQFRKFRVRRDTLEAAGGWFDEARRFWSASFDRLDAHLARQSGDRDHG